MGRWHLGRRGAAGVPGIKRERAARAPSPAPQGQAPQAGDDHDDPEADDDYEVGDHDISVYIDDDDLAAYYNYSRTY